MGHAVIGTPGRINDFLEGNQLRLQQAYLLVLDEADRMLDMAALRRRKTAAKSQSAMVVLRRRKLAAKSPRSAMPVVALRSAMPAAALKSLPAAAKSALPAVIKTRRRRDGEAAVATGEDVIAQAEKRFVCLTSRIIRLKSEAGCGA